MAADRKATGGDLRSDALRNRENILSAALELFAARGIDVPMAAVARRAGVGTATLYRRFPTRDALVVEAFTDQVSACADVVERALLDPDPWRGFATAVERITAMQVADRGFSAAVVHAHPQTEALEERRVQAENTIDRLVRRAKAAGVVRPDLHRTDLTLVLMAVDGVRAETPEKTAVAVRRLVAHLLESFRSGPAPHPAMPPPAPIGLSPFG